MSEPFIAEIKMFGSNFAPRGYAFCNGQLLSIAQNTALFSLIGTIYGGNGQTTFGLPDFRGRVPVGSQGAGPGLPAVQQGELGGTVNTTITIVNLPAHTHALLGSSAPGDASSPAGALLAAPGTSGDTQYLASTAPNATLAGNSISPTGGNQPISNMQPYLGINFIIAVQGIFPSRN